MIVPPGRERRIENSEDRWPDPSAAPIAAQNSRTSEAALGAESVRDIILRHGSKGVFIGDSNTEFGAQRNAEQQLGEGYVRILHEYFLSRHPERRVRVLNEGVSGNTVSDLCERWYVDVIRRSPNWISVAIGVNDALFKPDQLAAFETDYRGMLTAARRASPNVAIILAECYLVGDGPNLRNFSDGRGERAVTPEERRALQDAISKRNAVIARLAGEFGAVLVPLERELRENPDHEAYPDPSPDQCDPDDGVHPAVAGGHLRIARAWLQATGCDTAVTNEGLLPCLEFVRGE